MKIQFINNHGSGFSDEIDVADGTNVSQFFREHMRGGKPEDFMIRVNRQHTPADYVLQPNDRISITPVKIEGARQPLALPLSRDHEPWRPLAARLGAV